MKKIIAMSLMALISMTMLAGNIEKGKEPINSTVKVNEVSDNQIVKKKCYKHRVLRQLIFPTGASQPMVQIHEEYGRYTEQEAIARQNDLRMQYFDHTDGYGNQHIYLTGYSTVHVSMCINKVLDPNIDKDVTIARP